MLEILSINLENEMDLPLTHKKAVGITKYLGLSVATQTAFATAVSEVCRAVIDKTLHSVLSFRAKREDGRWLIRARVVTDCRLSASSQELIYAKRLIPVIDVQPNGEGTVITLQLNLPRSVKISGDLVSRLANHVATAPPESPYEEIKQRNQELNTLSEKKDEQLRLATLLNEKKSEFLSIASHELRSPLTIIKAYAQIGKSFKDKNPEKMAEYLEKINQQATKVNVLIQQLLDLAKIENNKVDYRIEKVELSAFLSETLASVALSHPTHPVMFHANGPVYANIDKLRIEQVLVNLVSNAAKYSPNDKPITVALGEPANEQVIISVTDQGIGLSAENLSRVFDKFFRAEEVAQKVSGLGMGLYITTRIIKGHKGKIWADSKENEGSVFYFSLPVV
ncbi:HAMP domain-containing histidine kinase [Mucilaginibacter robiniae]|uniref:histidine kinase n=1 Tax=Mucilaginibacter robiniae TaxID=2728022 RepID=A0A7L5E3X0_9SPHI|nr:HAMP domain-containing sensor histidine kinase [Mucilaginibacter robiniae]QJD96979.1 HAMP domain-containing histidine kinase [Mucilaginibacter robiniae]